MLGGPCQTDLLDIRENEHKLALNESIAPMWWRYCLIHLCKCDGWSTSMKDLGCLSRALKNSQGLHAWPLKTPFSLRKY